MAQIFLVAGPDRPFLLVLYYTLARVDEILRLRWEDVNFEEDTVPPLDQKAPGRFLGRRRPSYESDPP